jgi:hypothetical protein
MLRAKTSPSFQDCRTIWIIQSFVSPARLPKSGGADPAMERGVVSAGDGSCSSDESET